MKMRLLVVVVLLSLGVLLADEKRAKRGQVGFSWGEKGVRLVFLASNEIQPDPFSDPTTNGPAETTASPSGWTAICPPAR
jgi:hypothetical protein